MRRYAYLLSLFLVTATRPVLAEETPVDSEQQCTMFKRIFSYDKHLRESDKIVVLVVGQSSDTADIAAVADAFRSKGMFPAAVTVDGLTDDLTATLSPKSTVVYMMPGVDYGAVNAFAESRGFLSIAGMPSLAESGQVSVSVDMASGQPEIVVNMARLSAEGHELSSELLRLARVIR
jgi:hypothetical protein